VTPKELSGFKNALESERDTVVHAALRRRQRITVEQSADAFEQINYATERELALAGLSRHSELLRQIQAALCRIEARTFGVCQRCQTAIRRKRLIAIPWTPLCLQCQELADGHDSIDELRATAA